MNEILAEKIINDSEMTATEKWEALKGVREKEQEIRNQVYDFLGEKISKDSRLKEYAEECWNHMQSMTFSMWYKITYLNPETWSEMRNKMDGVDDFLGYLIFEEEYEEFIEKIGFKEFLNGIDTHCDVHLKYVGGYVVGVKPTVYIEVDLLD